MTVYPSRNFLQSLAAVVTFIFCNDAVAQELAIAPFIPDSGTIAAIFIGCDEDVGAIAPGRFGDLIAVTGDPLADVTVLQNVGVVIKGGLVFKRL